MAEPTRTPQEIRDTVAGLTAQADAALAAGDPTRADALIDQAQQLVDLHQEITGVPIGLDGEIRQLQFRGNVELSDTERLAANDVDPAVLADLTKEQQAGLVAEREAAATAAKPAEIEAALKDWVQGSLAVDVSRLDAAELAAFIEANQEALDQAVLRTVTLPPDETLLGPGRDPIVLDDVARLEEYLSTEIPVRIPESLEGKVLIPGTGGTPTPPPPPGSTGTTGTPPKTAGGRTGSTTPPPPGSTPPPTDRPDTGTPPPPPPDPADSTTGTTGPTTPEGTNGPGSPPPPDDGAGDTAPPTTPGDTGVPGDGGPADDTSTPGDGALPGPAGSDGAGSGAGPGDGSGIDGTGDVATGSGLPAVPYHREVWFSEDGPSYFNDTSTGKWYDEAGNEITDPGTKAALDAFADQVAGPGDGDPLGGIVPSGQTAEDVAAAEAEARAEQDGSDADTSTGGSGQGETGAGTDGTGQTDDSGGAEDTDDGTDDGDSGGSGSQDDSSDGSSDAATEDADAEPPPDEGTERPGPDQVTPLDSRAAAHAEFLLGDVGDTHHAIRTAAGATADVNPVRETGGELGTVSGAPRYDSTEVGGFDPIVDPGEERVAFGSGEVPTIEREDTGDIDPSDLPGETTGGPHPFAPSTASGDISRVADLSVADLSRDPAGIVELTSFDAAFAEPVALADRSTALDDDLDDDFDVTRSVDLSGPSRLDDDLDLD